METHWHLSPGVGVGQLFPRFSSTPTTSHHPWLGLQKLHSNILSLKTANSTHKTQSTPSHPPPPTHHGLRKVRTARTSEQEEHRTRGHGRLEADRVRERPEEREKDRREQAARGEAEVRCSRPLICPGEGHRSDGDGEGDCSWCWCWCGWSQHRCREQ